jgi:ABC-type iron transport system FetAB ATPase subunit
MAIYALNIRMSLHKREKIMVESGTGPGKSTYQMAACAIL